MYTFYYRTVDKEGNILETWNEREKVQPLRDYHRIQFVRAYPNQDIPPVVLDSWVSVADFYNVPM